MSAATLGELFEASKAELSTVQSTASAILEKMQDGITYEEGIEIANRFWEPRQAQELKLRLSCRFPDSNAEVMKNYGFGKRLMAHLVPTQTVAFIEAANEAIQVRLQEVIDHLNGTQVQETGGVNWLDGLRLQVAYFVDGSTWGAFEYRGQLSNQAVLKWRDLNFREVESVEKGDYLFMEDLPLLVKNALDNYVKDYLNGSWSLNVDCLKSRFQTVRVTAEFVMLFYHFLEEYVSGQ